MISWELIDLVTTPDPTPWERYRILELSGERKAALRLFGPAAQAKAEAIAQQWSGTRQEYTHLCAPGWDDPFEVAVFAMAQALLREKSWPATLDTH